MRYSERMRHNVGRNAGRKWYQQQELLSVGRGSREWDERGALTYVRVAGFSKLRWHCRSQNRQSRDRRETVTRSAVFIMPPIPLLHIAGRAPKLRSQLALEKENWRIDATNNTEIRLVSFLNSLGLQKQWLRYGMKVSCTHFAFN